MKLIKFISFFLGFFIAESLFASAPEESERKPSLLLNINVNIHDKVASIHFDEKLLNYLQEQLQMFIVLLSIDEGAFIPVSTIKKGLSFENKLLKLRQIICQGDYENYGVQVSFSRLPKEEIIQQFKNLGYEILGAPSSTTL